MLQNEAGDANEDLEHFEDIPDNDDNPAGNDFNKDQATDTSCESDNDADNSFNRSNFPNSDSEENGFSESDDLFGEDGLDKLEESKPTSDQEKHNIQDRTRTRPGGYDPRHREPRYWYKLWFYIFKHDKSALIK